MIRVMKAVSLVALCTLIIAVPSVWANWVQDGAAICTTAINQWLPIIISDGAGGAIVTWYAGSSGGDDDVYAQRVNASGSVQWAANGGIEGIQVDILHIISNRVKARRDVRPSSNEET